MSSQPNPRLKGNSKKSQQVIQLQKHIQHLIHQNLQLSITIRKLTDNTCEIKSLSTKQQIQHQKDLSAAEQLIDRLQTINQAQTDHIQVLVQKKDQSQIQNGRLNYQIEKLVKELEEEKSVAKQDFDQLKRYYQSEIRKYQAVIGEYQIAINQRVSYLSQNQSLQKQLISTKQQQKRQIADKDRDKLQAIDFLKKEMQQKIKELKSNLLNMRRDQMATNTRLTELQNHQLLEELEYQSKHTENVLRINLELEKKVDELMKEFEVEKEIAQELAKRSTMAKKIIKNLAEKINSLQKELQNYPQQQQINQSQQNPQKSTFKQPFPTKPNQQTIKMLTKTIKHLQSQLTIIQKQLQKTLQEKSHFQKLYEQNHPKYEYYLKTESDLRLLMLRFLGCNLEGKKDEDKTIGQYDISRLKDRQVTQWTKNDIEMTVKMLLNFLKPHLTLKNMKTYFLRHKKWHLSNNEDSIDELIQNERIEQEIESQNHKKIQHRKRLISPKIKSLSSSNLNNTICQPYSKPSLQSTNVSPSKDHTLFSLIQDQKHKSLCRQHKNLSHHNLSQTNSIPLQRSFSKHHNNLKEMKYNIKQKHEFRPELFIRKEKNPSRMLVRTNIRDWGKKVQITAKGAFLVKQK